MYVDRITKHLKILENVLIVIIEISLMLLLDSSVLVIVIYNPQLSFFFFFSKQYFIIRWKGLSVWNLCYTENYNSFLFLLNRDLTFFLVYGFPMSMHDLRSFFPSKLHFQSACEISLMPSLFSLFLCHLLVT